MNKIILQFAAVLLFSFLALGCKNEMKYILFDDSDNLQGNIIFEKRGNKNLCYFDLGQNKIFEIPFANLRMVNGFLASYAFYKDDYKNIMVRYIENNNKLCLQFIELIFSNNLDQKLIDSKEIEGLSIKKIVDTFRYLPYTRELYYNDLYSDNALLINIDTFKMLNLYSEMSYTPHPVDFLGDKYLALGLGGIYFYDEDKIENIFDFSDPFIKCASPRYSAVLRKVLYRKDENGKSTIAIFDAESLQIIDTGITPMKYNREDSDKYKYHFFGERYILYARYKRNASSFMKKYFKPIEYIIYDYIDQKEIGYIENCQLNAFYDFFPKDDAEAAVTKLIETREQL